MASAFKENGVRWASALTDWSIPKNGGTIAARKYVGRFHDFQAWVYAGCALGVAQTGRTKIEARCANVVEIVTAYWAGDYCCLTLTVDDSLALGTGTLSLSQRECWRASCTRPGASRTSGTVSRTIFTDI